MQEAIGFQNQPWYSGACGKYALQHVLLLLGVPITQKDANKATRIPSVLTFIKGTNEKALIKAIKYFDCTPIIIKGKKIYLFKKQIDNYLSKGCPIILSVESGSHWVTLAGKKSKNLYYWIDSADPKIVGYWTWQDIMEWCCEDCGGEGIVECDNCDDDGRIDCDDCDGDGCINCQGRGWLKCDVCHGKCVVECDSCFGLYGIAILPKDANQLKHSIVNNFTPVYNLLIDDDELCEYWGWYLEDLNEVFDCPKNTQSIMTSEEFAKKYGRMIYDSINYYYLYADENQMAWEMGNYRKVANAYKLFMSKEKVHEAIAGLSAALTVIACNP
jgi:hypothetical protein